MLWVPDALVHQNKGGFAALKKGIGKIRYVGKNLKERAPSLLGSNPGYVCLRKYWDSGERRATHLLTSN